MSKSVESPLERFCSKHGIDIEVHNKRETKGCVQAIEARSQATGQPLSLQQELKTLLLVTAKGDFVAIHMPGNMQLKCRRSQMTDYCREYRDMPHFDLISQKLGLADDNGIVGMAHSVSGTLNPISLHLRYSSQPENPETYKPKLLQFFDKSLNPARTYYTNAGDKTHGIKIQNLQQVMDAIPHRVVEVTEARPLREQDGAERISSITA